MTPGHRRDFLLDSGAITAFATSQQLTGQYLDWIDRDFTGSLLIPVPVLTEIRTGDPRKDVLVDRLINRIRGEHGVYLSLSPTAASRAGVLRTEALPLISEDEDISTTDAQIVGSAEERSAFSAITILTTDPNHINLLVGLTRRANIAVDIPG